MISNHQDPDNCLTISQKKSKTIRADILMKTLYEKIGGAAAVDAAVNIFYTKVMTDDRIKHFFEGVDMKRQSGHQKAFLTYALGGAPNYQGKNMRESHKHLVEKLGLTDLHFDAVMENLATTLAELGVATELIEEVANVVESTRNDVLNR
jgi:hemoglobin